jgi:hypothetical protein
MMRAAYLNNLKEKTGMSFSAYYLPAVLLTILSLPFSLWAQTAPKQTSKAPRSSISGRVTIKEKGAAGVVISLRKSDFTSPFEQLPRATTDYDGFYRIANVPPGTYDVTPVVPAFVPAEAKEQRAAKTVLVGEDENVESINFALVRGGVITGRVTDADRRPVIQQQVFIYRADAFEQQAQGQQRPVFATGGAQTDDRGIYRVFGLLPGRYKVAAGRSENTFTPSAGSPRSSYKQVFHPDVTDHTKALVIEVGEGTEATNVDIALGRALQTFSIAGRVIDGERGLPVPGIRLGVQRGMGQRVELLNTFGNSNAQGDFVIDGLIPGKYEIYLYSNQISGMRLEAVTLDVVDQDINGITVKLVKGSSLSGIVALEKEDKAARAKFSELQLRAFVSSPGMGASGSTRGSTSSPIGADGSFHLEGLPSGSAHILLGSMTGPFAPKGFGFVRLERDGVVVPRAIELKEGEQLTGFRVVLIYGTAIVQGVVTLENGTLPDGGRIDVRLIKPGEPPVLMTPVPRVDARGHFRIEGVAAGTYEIHASVSGLGPPFHHRVSKREITVPDAVTTDVTISIDMSGPLRKP